MSFDETSTPRDAGGRFAEKTGAPAEVELNPNVIDRGDGVVCNVFVGWSFASCRGCGWEQDTKSKAEAEAAAQAHRENPGYDDVVIEVGRLATVQKFMRDGVPHRVGAPAYRHTKAPAGHGDYFQNGGLHRTDGPASFHGEYDDMNSWWVEGEEVELSAEEKRDLAYDLSTVFDGHSLTEDRLDDDDKTDVGRVASDKLFQMIRTRVLNERVRAQTGKSFGDE